MTGRGDGTVTNCYFSNNRSQAFGAAIGLYYFTGKLEIDGCYFEGNTTSQNSSGGDGGAVGIMNNGQAATLDIANSTFYRNLAHDDGGAVFYEGQAGSRVGGTIKNCTFVEDKGLNDYYGTMGGLSNRDSGGAVQLSLKADVTFLSNTFYNNEKAGYYGGAIGYHWHLTSGIPTFELQDNLFVGNTAGSGEKYHNVHLIGFTDNGGNIGLDNGSALPGGLTTASVFGTDAPVLSGNGSEIYCGQNSSFRIPTLLPAPRQDDTEGIYADGALKNRMPATAADARAMSRFDPADTGAVDLVWTRLDANGGSWKAAYAATGGTWGDANSSYHNDANATGVFLVGLQGDGSTASLPAYTATDLAKEGETLQGWATTAGGAVEYSAGSVIPLTENTLYAVWGTGPQQVTVTFDPLAGQWSDAPATGTRAETIHKGTAVAAPGTVALAGHTFAGWYTAETGGAKWVFTDPVNAPMTLYARYTANPPETLTVTFDPLAGRWSDAPATGTRAETIHKGATAAAPGTVALAGYAFAGWYTAETGGAPWVFTDPVNAPMTLYARWTSSGGGGGGGTTKPDPDPTPTPTPTPTPDPVPIPSPGGGGSGDSSTVNRPDSDYVPIGEQPVPLANLPELATIFDDDVPLAALPQTGGLGIPAQAGIVVFLASLSLAALLLRRPE